MRPTEIAKMAATNVAAAPRSLACFAKGCFSLVARSIVRSIAVLNISEIKTKAIANDNHSHSCKVTSKKRPNEITTTATTA